MCFNKRWATGTRARCLIDGQGTTPSSFDDFDDARELDAWDLVGPAFASAEHTWQYMSRPEYSRAFCKHNTRKHQWLLAQVSFDNVKNSAAVQVTAGKNYIRQKSVHFRCIFVFTSSCGNGSGISNSNSLIASKINKSLNARTVPRVSRDKENQGTADLPVHTVAQSTRKVLILRRVSSTAVRIHIHTWCAWISYASPVAVISPTTKGRVPGWHAATLLSSSMSDRSGVSPEVLSTVFPDDWEHTQAIGEQLVRNMWSKYTDFLHIFVLWSTCQVSQTPVQPECNMKRSVDKRANLKQIVSHFHNSNRTKGQVGVLSKMLRRKDTWHIKSRGYFAWGRRKRTKKTNK